MTVEESDLALIKTPRREARENYVRFLLAKAGFDAESTETFLNTKQASLFDESPLTLIYTGRYETAVSAVENIVD